MLRKWLTATLLVATLLAAGTAMAADTYKIKLAYVVPETQSTHIAAKDVFKPYVEEASQGRITVELYPNGQLGGDRQAIEGVQLGTIHMTIPAVQFSRGSSPSFRSSTFPSSSRTNSRLQRPRRRTRAETERTASHAGHPQPRLRGERLPPHLEQPGSHHQAGGPQGAQNPHHGEPRAHGHLPALGANPTPISFGELYTPCSNEP